MFHEVRFMIPSIASWIECSYGSQPIFLNDQSILRCGGVQQGDYLDDGTLCDSQEDLAAALSIIEAEGPPRDLFLNRAKSFIFSPANSPITHPLLCDIPTSSDGFILLGSPMGPSSYCESVVSTSVSKVQDMLSRLRYLEDSQMETTLLWSCLALPKVAYVLHTCPPSLIPKALGSFDSGMLSAILLGVRHLTGHGWRPLSHLVWDGWVSDEPLCMPLLPTFVPTNNADPSWPAYWGMLVINQCIFPHLLHPWLLLHPGRTGNPSMTSIFQSLNTVFPEWFMRPLSMPC